MLMTTTIVTAMVLDSPALSVPTGTRELSSPWVAGTSGQSIVAASPLPRTRSATAMSETAREPLFVTVNFISPVRQPSTSGAKTSSLVVNVRSAADRSVRKDVGPADCTYCEPSQEYVRCWLNRLYSGGQVPMASCAMTSTVTSPSPPDIKPRNASSASSCVTTE